MKTKTKDIIGSLSYATGICLLVCSIPVPDTLGWIMWGIGFGMMWIGVGSSWGKGRASTN